MSIPYFVAAIAIAAGITFVLRLLPFIFQRALGQSQLLHTFARWIPLGAMMVLAGYAIWNSPVGQMAPAESWPYVLALVVTVGLHMWRRQILLSISVGTLVCVLLSSGVGTA